LITWEGKEFTTIIPTDVSTA